jgi:dipeptidyl aminopeptidase/acylaminoacyl peptidase
MYGERYMDTPQENRDGYKSTSLLDKVENIKGNTLVIHGDIDPVVVWQHSLQLLKKSVDKDVMIDYAVYPQHEHNVRGDDRVHLIKRIVRYFDDYLKQ